MCPGGSCWAMDKELIDVCHNYNNYNDVASILYHNGQLEPLDMSIGNREDHIVL